MGEHSERGRRGEAIAERHLRRRGWTILARRWRAAGGELDLVAARAQTVIFCEVKTRSSERALVEPLTRAQRARIARAAAAFVALHPGIAERRLRLDLITVQPSRYRAKVRHLAGFAADP